MSRQHEGNSAFPTVALWPCVNPRVSILKGFTFKEIIWGLVGSGRGVSITEAFAGFGTSKKGSHLKKSFRKA